MREYVAHTCTCIIYYTNMHTHTHTHTHTDWQATRYNYTREEKYALVEVIGMIKGLSLLMHRMEHQLSAGIRHHIFLLVQKFVQVSVRDSIRKAVKGKKLQTKT